MAWQKSFHVKEFDKFWRVSPVPYGGEVCAIELKKKPLDDGKPRTLPYWIEYSKKAIDLDYFYVGSSELHHSLTDSLCQNRGHPKYKAKVEDIRTFLESQFKQDFPWTLTKVIYEPYSSQQPDTVIHNPSMPDNYSLLEHMFGATGSLNTLWDADRMCDALLGTDDAGRVNAIYRWILRQNTFLHRNHQKQPRQKERGVLLGSFGGSFHIVADTSINNTKPALGMRVRKKQTENF